VQYGDAVSVLRSVPLFANLDLARLKLLAFSSTYLTFENSEALFHEGDPADSVYMIDEGEVEICAQSDGHEVSVGRLGRKELFGEMAIFRNSPRSATIRAVGQVKVLKIDADVFIGLVTENPESALGVMRILSDKLARLTESFGEAEDRIRTLESVAGAGKAN